MPRRRRRRRGTFSNGKGCPEKQRERQQVNNLIVQMAMTQREAQQSAGGPASPSIAVAVDKDKNSHSAFKWALDNVVNRGQTLTLVHVNTKGSSGLEDDPNSAASIGRDLIGPFRLFCKRKDVHCKDVIIEESDVVKAITDFVSTSFVQKLVVGASPKGGFVRSFRGTDISNSIFKGVPDFCTVYIVSKGKVSAMKNAARPPPTAPPLRAPVQPQPIAQPEPLPYNNKNVMKGPSEPAFTAWNLQKDTESIKSPFTRGNRISTTKSYGELMLESDISFVSNSRPSIDLAFAPRMSNISDSFEGSFEPPRKSDAYSAGNTFSSMSSENSALHPMEDVEAEIRRLKLELKQTMDMYSTACKEALTAKQKATELQKWKVSEEKRLEEARLSEEAAIALAEREKSKCFAAMQTAEASQRIAELEAQKRLNAEMQAAKDAKEKKAAFDAMSHTNLRYRKYSIEEIEAATENFASERKIGEGGYGPVYRCNLDHTPVAIKVLRPDAAQGRSQFQQEVEILCCIRHPNMVLLLGACPEYGCLVYEYMANGSLEDRLFRRGNTPPIPWQHRFRIAAEIGTGLLFLHQTKPEPLVHRDLKPANILLDRNYVSKISDVGLARLVPPSVANNVTQYRMTATAGTFCYIDPEYQQTGMLGIKSDIYSLGILLLQLITGKPPMGLTHYVERSIEIGTFTEMLDQSVPDWPIAEALSLAKLSLKCAELRRKDRPDLGTVILPELNRLRDLAEDSLQQSMFGMYHSPSPVHSHASSSTQDMVNGSAHSGSRSRHSGTAMPGRNEHSAR